MISVSMTELSTKTKEVVASVKDGQKIVILYRNRPVAVLISPSDAEVNLDPLFEKEGKGIIVDV